MQIALNFTREYFTLILNMNLMGSEFLGGIWLKSNV